MNVPNNATLENKALTRSPLVKWFFPLFCILFVTLPPAWALFCRTSPELSQGRLGLILPVLIVADPMNRWILWKALGLFIFTTFTVQLLGLWLGFVGTSRKSRLARLTYQISLLPAKLPVWILPFCVYAILGKNPLGAVHGLNIWVAWVCCWGILKIAQTVSHVVSHLDSSPYEAVLRVHDHFLAKYRLSLRPSLNPYLRHDALQIGLVLLFDPTPVFLGLANEDWPMAKLLQHLKDQSTVGLSLASGWLFWSIFIVFICRLIDMALFKPNRHTIYHLSESKPNFGCQISPAFAPLWIIALLPSFVFCSLIFYFIIQSISDNSFVTALQFSDPIIWSFGFNILLCSLLTLLLGFPLYHRPIASQVIVHLNPILTYLPLALSGVALITLAIGFQENPELKLSTDLLQSGMVIYLIISILISAVGNLRHNQRPVGLVRNPEDASTTGWESAVILGAKPYQARKFSQISSKNGITHHNIQLFLTFWWICASPIWLITPRWIFLPYQVWGQLWNFNDSNAMSIYLGFTALPLLISLVMSLASAKKRS